MFFDFMPDIQKILYRLSKLYVKIFMNIYKYVHTILISEIMWLQGTRRDNRIIWKEERVRGNYILISKMASIIQQDFSLYTKLGKA